MEKEPFPRTVITGDFFCNRTKERAKLNRLFRQGTHIWLQAHRRHGKTSLLTQVTEDMKANGEKVAVERCHLIFNTGSDSIIAQLIKTAEALMSEVAKIATEDKQEAKGEGLLKYLTNKLAKTTINVSIERGMPSLRFGKLTSETTLEALRRAISELDAYAMENDIRVIFIIDEFQELGKVNEGVAIESIVRDRLEQAESIAFVFCGSERTLMNQSLSDDKRPLYNHTKPFPLKRIEAIHYEAHLKKLSKENSDWNEEISDASIAEIMRLTERHPYYVNALCGDLWVLPNLPTVQDVKDEWLELVSNYEREEAGTLLRLKPREKRVLSVIAQGFGQSMFSVEALSRLKLNNGSVQQSLKKLIELDLVEEKTETGYMIVNPVISEIARRVAL